MAIKYNDFKVQPLRDQKYKVLQNICYKDIVVPAGYRTNGGNIPRLFWSILPPNDSEMLPLYIIHDYLCDREQYKKADEYLYSAGIELNVTKWKLKAVYYAVRLYHKIKYNL